MIYGADHIAEDFIARWHSASPTIEAHTSGSTGQPKLILLPKSDMTLSAKATCEFFEIGKKSTLLMPLSAGYIAGKMMIVRSIISGADLWIESPSNRPIKRDYGMIDLLPLVTSQTQWIIDNPRLSLSIKNIIVGGGALSPRQEEALSKLPCNVYATYGMTETCSHVALRCITKGENFYTALPDISFDVDDRGCLIIVAPKYSFKRLTTNDIVDLTSSTKFIWRGRYDNVINSGGIKIFPEELEKKIASIVDVPFYVVGRHSDKWGCEVVLYIESVDYPTSALMERLRTILPPYSLPKEILLKSEFQRTDSGKIKRVLF